MLGVNLDCILAYCGQGCLSAYGAALRGLQYSRRGGERETHPIGLCSTFTPSATFKLTSFDIALGYLDTFPNPPGPNQAVVFLDSDAGGLPGTTIESWDLNVAASFLAGMLFGLTATDAENIVIAVLMMVVVAVAACILPARRATRIDPLNAIRYE